MKAERSKVDFPLWRKKVDGSLFHYKGTSIPTWACSMWRIQEQFCECRSKKHLDSKVKILFNRTEYEGWVTIAPEGRKTPNYRLWFSDDLLFKIKDVFLMSFMRDLEYRLLKDKIVDIEDEIPFWEFIDIEYNKESRIFYFTSHYIQKPSFPELFKRLIGSPTLHKIDDELEGKGEFRIYKQNWKPKEELESELGAENVLYTLIDTDNKLIYVGEAGNLVKRLLQAHSTIPHWNYFRYDVLPEQLSKHRVLFERMLIRDFASLLHNKKDVPFISISDYTLSNDKIDK